MILCADNCLFYHEGMLSVTKTVLEKLGWVASKSGVVHGVPPDLANVFAPIVTQDDVPSDWAIWFVPDMAAIKACANAAAAAYKDGGQLWFAYPKQTGAIKTDMTRDIGWAALDAHSLMPVSQVAIDATWSALRFRRRHEIKKLTRKT
jgi:hypothetical protein